MRLEVTRRSDLAARALVLLDRSSRRMKAAELADRLGTSAGFVPQVLASLVERSWVRSDPGPTGGYSLSVDLDAVSVLELVEAVEGPVDTTRCVVENRPCDGRDQCALHQAWGRARESLLADLDSTTVASLGRKDER
jgi:Rrf2 family transcriptional regulator, iron-sulfur cluster assembly transcription factor